MSNQVVSVPFCITLLPSLEIVARCLTLEEAAAYMKTYNSIMANSHQRAVIEQTQESYRQRAAA